MYVMVFFYWRPISVRFCVILMFMCFVFPTNGFAKQKDYRKKLHFLDENLKELEQIKIKSKYEQIKIRYRDQEYKNRKKEELEEWIHLELEAINMTKKLEDTIKKLQIEYINNMLIRYAKEERINANILKDINLERLDGKMEKIKEHKGNIILLHFWATWCHPCVKEMVSLKKTYNMLKPNNFEILAISLDARKKDITNFLKEKIIRFPVYFDPGRRVYDQILGGVEILPRSLLLDKTGKISKSYAGEQQWESQERMDDIRTLLSH